MMLQLTFWRKCDIIIGVNVSFCAFDMCGPCLKRTGGRKDENWSLRKKKLER